MEQDPKWLIRLKGCASAVASKTGTGISYRKVQCKRERNIGIANNINQSNITALCPKAA
jgi:hypothetical protein